MEKKALIISGGIVLIILSLSLACFLILPSRLVKNGVIKEEPARKNIDQKIYSVEELSKAFKSDPDYFKDIEIKVQAIGIGGTAGIGCSDYSIASDIIPSDYQSSIVDPNNFSNRVSIDAVMIGEYGIYTGHFFDKNRIEECKQPEIFVVTSQERLDLNLPVLNKKEVISNGYIVIGGELLQAPYEILLNGNNITVNGRLFMTNNSNFPSRNSSLEFSFDSLVESMKNGDLEVINNQSKYSIPNGVEFNPQKIIEDFKNLMHSSLSDKEKMQKLKDFLNTNQYSNKEFDDILKKWKL